MIRYDRFYSDLIKHDILIQAFLFPYYCQGGASSRGCQ
jgi:hypothetical protein